jgi:tRNA1Val (adenine37-N6)-methyltransferase
MANNYFNFKQFTVIQEKSAFKVGTDGVLLGASAKVSDKDKVLDIGTGTGLISLMIAQRCDAEIFAIEPDQQSYTEASENVHKSKWSSRIKVINTNLQNYFPEEMKFDLIVSNPPYFTDSLKNPDPRKSGTRHTDSLTSTELLYGTSRLLESNGIFQVIMPYAEGNLLIAEAAQYGLFCFDILKIRPLPTSEIRRLILTFSKERKKATEKFLTIEHGPRHEFTEEYINLTKDFYLKFL